LLDDALDDRKAQAGALVTVDGLVCAIELIEDVRLVLLGDADPGIPDAQHQEVALWFTRYADLALFWRVLDRVFAQVADQLPQAQRVAEHGRRVVRRLDLQNLLLRLPLVLALVNDRLNDFRQGRQLAVLVEARLDLAQFQQVGDQRCDRLHAVDNALRELVLRVVERAGAPQQFQIAQDRRQWRAQVVRDSRHELALDAV